jgi:hypothetical protein
MKTTILNQEQLEHSKVLASLLQNYSENNKELYNILDNTLSLIMSIEYITDRDLTLEEYHRQRNLIEHFQKELTKKVVNIY